MLNLDSCSGRFQAVCYRFQSRTRPAPRASAHAPRRVRGYDGASRLALCATLLALLAGCAHVPNPWREDGPSAVMDWDSPTAADVYARFEPAVQLQRDWPRVEVAAESGAVTHWPLYFEDPFEDKGAGRAEYRLGWEDYIAMPYSYARFTLNWLMLPVSAIVTPPWTLMESDGNLSRQMLGYDHDATPVASGTPAGESTGEQEGEEAEETEAGNTGAG